MSKKIICLDDSEMILEILKYSLTQEGFEVFTATTWPEINNYIFKENIRFLVTDVQMPGLTGSKLCQVLKDSVPDLKIYLFSSLPDQELVDLTSEHNADGWISKNIPREEWVSLIKEAYLQEMGNRL